MRKVLFILYLVFFVSNGISAQSNYPIYVTPALTPPYSLKLSDYCKFGSQQLMVSIVVNDLNISNLPVKLHVKLETVGITIETPPTISTTPIYLDGGAANILSGDDLKDYFDINNLIFKGYSKEAYKRTGQLPEGFYKITIEILHFQTNRVISNQGSVTAWMALGKPPVLKLPENGKEMGEFKGMPIVFSWLASNVGSPVSANSIQYKFEMWEMRIDGISPYTVAATVPVFHEETSQNTTLSLFPSSLLMEPGMKYAWRVTASDLNGMVPFEQDGHSEIRVFTYKAKCGAVTNLKADLAGSTGTFNWETGKNHTSYNVEMRKPATGWLSSSETYDNKAEFYDLDYGSTYEMRVQAVCDGDPESVSDFSDWKSLVIPAKRTNADTATCPKCGCGNNTGAGTIENLTLKQDLKPGDTISDRFGTTRFIVKSVEPQGNGVYKGHFLFWAEIWKLKFLCEYWDLSVNTDNVIVNMDYQSIYNPQYLLDVDATTAYLDKLAGAITELTVNATIKDTVSVNETITSIYVNAGDSLMAVTVGSDGQLHEVVIQTDSKDIEQTMVKGKNGEKYVVTRDGEIMGVKEYQNSGGGNNRKMDDYIKEKESKQLSSSSQVLFSASANQKYGFDAYSTEKSALTNKYPALQNGYRPSYKSIASFSPDKVVASSSGNGITFRDEMGIPPISSGTDLTVRGGTDGSVTALYAYKAVNDSTEEIAGKLNLMSFDEQSKKLYIVAVNHAQMPDAASVQTAVNKIYSQAVVRWEVVKIDSGVNITFESGHMTHGGSNAISVYNTDQKNIIKKFKETDDFEKDALYLFFVDNVQGKNGDIAGFMPLQQQVGFIYDNPNLNIIAHELGHGAFNLRHTFSTDNFIASQGTTKNLLDYNDGTELWKHQWELTHNPDNIWFAWAQKEEEGQGMSNSSETTPFALIVFEGKIEYSDVKSLKLTKEDWKKQNEKSFIINCYSNVEVDKKVKAMKDGGIIDDDGKNINLYTPENKEDKIYYFGDSRTFSIFSASMDKNGLISVNKPIYWDDESNKEHSEKKMDITVNAESTLKINFKQRYSYPTSASASTTIGGNTKTSDDILFRFTLTIKGVKPQLYYNSSVSDEKVNVKIKNETLNIYGGDNIELITFLRKTSNYDEYKSKDVPGESGLDFSSELFVKKIIWNKDLPSSKVIENEVEKWQSYTLDKTVEKNSITVFPVFGDPITYNINLLNAPDLTVVNNSYSDGSVGLDSYESYRSSDATGKYGEDTYTEYIKEDISGKKYYVPNILVTKFSPQEIKLKLETLDKSKVDGLCRYYITSSDETAKINPVVFKEDNYLLSLQKPLSEGDKYLTIKDASGNLKGKIRLVDKNKPETPYKVVIINLRYITESQTKSQTIVKSDITTMLNKTFNQIGKAWEAVGSVTDIINYDITDLYIKGLPGTFNKTKIMSLLNEGAKNKEDKGVYQNFLDYVYANNILAKIKLTAPSTNYYHMIFVPSNLNLNGYASGLNYCMISPSANSFTCSHELGHNLGLNHIGEDLGKCENSFEEEADCEAGIETNNIMGYSGERNSFWLWQRRNIKSKAK
jgi:hypothetical protein